MSFNGVLQKSRHNVQAGATKNGPGRITCIFDKHVLLSDSIWEKRIVIRARYIQSNTTSGFSYGFFGVKLQEPHTKAYLYGYGNGTSAFQLDKGFADGSAGFPKSLNTSGYLDAYDFGVQNWCFREYHK